MERQSSEKSKNWLKGKKDDHAIVIRNVNNVTSYTHDTGRKQSTSNTGRWS